MKNLKLLREKANMTQFELAKYLHVTQQTVNRYELGESESSYEVLNNIKNIFNVSPEYLIDDSSDLDEYHIDNKILLDKKEENWIDLFRKLDDNSKVLVIKLCQRLSHRMINDLFVSTHRLHKKAAFIKSDFFLSSYYYLIPCDLI